LRDYARVNHPNGLRVAVLSCGDFDLKRIAVSPWYISPYQFGFDVMLTGD